MLEAGWLLCRIRSCTWNAKSSQCLHSQTRQSLQKRRQLLFDSFFEFTMKTVYASILLQSLCNAAVSRIPLIRVEQDVRMTIHCPKEMH